MEIGKQIKKYRSELSLSQEEFADKIFVTRQTVSNWENDKSYPDINSLVLMSNVFGVSLDNLIKGDVDEMNEKIKTEDIESLNKENNWLTAAFIWDFFMLVPMLKLFGIWGAVIFGVVFLLGFIKAVKVEKQKKKLDIQTYKEINAFMEGKRLDEIEKQREIAKRPYQKILLAIGCAVAAFVITYLMAVIFKLEI
ncbi:MAG: helix-turn-helix transcriptional regulator [Oscillospiraceae bacterium]|nr:helix-turn-helix transcriptional regulator [Oscillospiraceae bacterium]MBQ2795570.1 helix-turn-helix transcriptional regulator [Oscillospiraceae bacterium]MBQ2862227.1 helix-turn-helix transcriptional regulator [Oscillospiraceae bacterium]MBQ2998661.1 helix-turn-helix transcriptional regulator [Oscillospiraceae bacterium]MBQ3560647.1 helix-turn-helix transcriptional regulator [Oscillospiraceae bacterium]